VAILNGCAIYSPTLPGSATSADLQRFATSVTATRHSHLRALPECSSGVLLRVALRWVGYHRTTQASIRNVGDVDLRVDYWCRRLVSTAGVDGWFVLVCDRKKYHDGPSHQGDDRRRDGEAALARLGTARFTYAHILRPGLVPRSGRGGLAGAPVSARAAGTPLDSSAGISTVETHSTSSDIRFGRISDVDGVRTLKTDGESAERERRKQGPCEGGSASP
jgi:hypothetical protein